MNRDARDESLKQAIRQRWPAERASDALRSRVQELFRGNRREQDPRALPPRPRWTLSRRLAVAAAVLVGLGMLGVLAYKAYESYEYFEYVEANMGRFAELMALQDSDELAPNSAGVLQVAASLQAPVAALPEATGWRIERVRTFTFHGETVACADFQRDGAALSVLSFPASALIDAHDGFSYQVNAGGGVLAGAIHADRVFCVTSRDPAQSSLVAEAAKQLVIHRARDR